MNTLWMAQISDALARGPSQRGSGHVAARRRRRLRRLVAAIFYLRRQWRQPTGWLVLGFQLMGSLILGWQIRGTILATALGIPFGAWAVAAVRRVYHVKASVLRGLAFAGVAAGSAAAAWASAGEALQVRLTDHSVLKEHDHRLAGSKACTMPDAFRSLASAPPGVMLNHFAFSAGVLVWTDHSVLSCPYHRHVTGTLTAINARRSSADRARAIVDGSLAD